MAPTLLYRAGARTHHDAPHEKAGNAGTKAAETGTARVNLIDFEPQQRHAPPWPTLEDIDWGHVGDERMEGIAKLRALANDK